MKSRSLRFVVGGVALAALWEALGRSGLVGAAFPPLSNVVMTLMAPERSGLFLQAIGSTARSAILGLLIGAVIGMGIAAVRQALIPTRSGLDRFAALMHAIPQVAIAPVMIVLVGRSNAPIAVSVIATFFLVYVGATRALANAGQVQQDVFTVLGSTRRARFFRLDLPSALPGLADALKLAAPAAVLGAVLGEWFGAPSGVGILILTSSENYDIPMLWATALLSTLMAMVGFAIFAGLQQYFTRRFT